MNIKTGKQTRRQHCWAQKNPSFPQHTSLLARLSPLTHASFSYSAVLFAECPCLTLHRHPHPRLLTQPLWQQHSGEPPTVIGATVTYCGLETSVCESGDSSDPFYMCWSHHEYVSHMIPGEDKCSPQCPPTVEEACRGPIHVRRSTPSQREGHLPHSFEPRLVTMVTRLSASPYWPLLSWWPVIDFSPGGFLLAVCPRMVMSPRVACCCRFGIDTYTASPRQGEWHHCKAGDRARCFSRGWFWHYSCSCLLFL